MCQVFIGLGKAAELALLDLDKETIRITALRDKLIRGILDNIEGTRLNGHPAQRLSNNVHVSIDYVEENHCFYTLIWRALPVPQGLHALLRALSRLMC
jgi:cysteine desulfurase